MVALIIVLALVIGLANAGVYKLFGVLFGTITLISLCLSVYAVFIYMLLMGRV